MKALVWQAVILSGVLALVGCTKQDNNASEEAKEVPMSAKPAENQSVGEQSDEQAPADSAEANAENADTAEGEEAEEEIAEVIDFDEKEAATATADAEVVDEGETESK